MRRHLSAELAFFLCFGLAIKSLQAQDTCIPKQRSTPCIMTPFPGVNEIRGVSIPQDARVTLQVRAAASHSPKSLSSVTATSNGPFHAQIDKLQSNATIAAALEPITSTAIIAGPAPVRSVQTNTSKTKTSAVPPQAPEKSTPKSQPVKLYSPLYTLGLAGISAVGSSTSSSTQQYFAEFNILVPVHYLSSHVCDGSAASSNSSSKKGSNPDPKFNVSPLEQKCWVWFNPRIASAPSANTTHLNSLTPSSVTSGVTGQSVGGITQTFEFQGGLQYNINPPLNGTPFGVGKDWARTSISVIVGGGILTRLNTNSGTAEYALNSNLAQQFNANTGLALTYPVLAAALCGWGFTGSSCSSLSGSARPTAVALVFPNRSRFYRDYYIGLRLNTFFLSGTMCNLSDQRGNTDCDIDPVFPGTFDIRFGQDETVTAGSLRGLVITLTGSYPLPGTGNTIRIFGSAYLRATTNNNSMPLSLVPLSSPVAISDPSVVVQEVQPSDQDYYRLGLGVDLIKAISKWVKGGQSN